MKTFREEVRKFYEPYYRDGDEAHLIDHADDVCDLALKINQECDEKLVILASYIHDLFNAQNRSIHNELAYEYLKLRMIQFSKLKKGIFNSRDIDFSPQSKSIDFVLNRQYF